MRDPLSMPQPVVSDLSKADKLQIVDEIKMLRQFIALVHLQVKGYVENQELSSAMEQRMASFDKDMASFRSIQKNQQEQIIELSTHVYELARKVVLYGPQPDQERQ